jgi:cyclohexadieny/prephenate dehydrogenase
VKDADLVVLCTPIGTYGTLAAQIAPHLMQGANPLRRRLGQDRRSCAMSDRMCRTACTFVPGHPVAGTEQSGPKPVSRSCSTAAGAS